VSSPSGASDWWGDIYALARRGEAAASLAMAKYIAERAANITLRRTRHAKGAWHRTPPGDPPAYASGNLARGMFYSALGTSAVAGNRVDYARILEYGCVVEEPANGEMVHWTDSGGSWYHTALPHPEHPFLRPTTEEAIRDGELRRAAIEGFRPYDP
jgi:hypothetical protein